MMTAVWGRQEDSKFHARLKEHTIYRNLHKSESAMVVGINIPQLKCNIFIQDSGYFLYLGSSQELRILYFRTKGLGCGKKVILVIN